jgi:glyoxylate carboligase
MGRTPQPVPPAGYTPDVPRAAADLFVDCLENEGVEYVFGIPGEETLDLSDALDRSAHIAFVPVRHEQGAAFMADAYGRLTGRPGVCLATLGPGPPTSPPASAMRTSTTRRLLP